MLTKVFALVLVVLIGLALGVATHSPRLQPARSLQEIMRAAADLV